MERVLLITAYPPSEVGAAVKNTKYLIKELSEDFCVDIVYFKDDDDVDYIPDNDNINIIKKVPNSIFFRLKNALGHPIYHPLFSVRYNRKVFRWLQERIEKNNYSALIFDHSQTFIYARKLKYNGVKILLSHDIEAQRVKRSSNKLMYNMCLNSEKLFLSTPGVQRFALCQKDVDLIYSLYGLDAKVSLIYIDERIEGIKPEALNNEFVMIGSWDRADNYEGAIWLLNGLPQYLSKTITVNIIGKRFPIDRIRKTDKIVINNLGFVDDPYPLISESKAMLSPLFSGAGIKVKVIDSLGCGTPVIGTDIAFEGFAPQYETFMMRCHDLQSFAKAIETVDYCLKERISFKQMFISDYKSTTIPKWLKAKLFS